MKHKELILMTLSLTTLIDEPKMMRMIFYVDNILAKENNTSTIFSWSPYDHGPGAGSDGYLTEVKNEMIATGDIFKIRERFHNMFWVTKDGLDEGKHLIKNLQERNPQVYEKIVDLFEQIKNNDLKWIKNKIKEDYPEFSKRKVMPGRFVLGIGNDDRVRN